MISTQGLNTLYIIETSAREAIIFMTTSYGRQTKSKGQAATGKG